MDPRLTAAIGLAGLVICCWTPPAGADGQTSAAATQPSAGPRLVKHTRKYLYGLNIEPPWSDGGFIEFNFPEHLQVAQAGTEIAGEAEGDGPSRWVVADDGRGASLDVTSRQFPKVRVRCSATVRGQAIELAIRVDNASQVDLPLLKLLACSRYRKLTGFAPGANPLTHTFVELNGKLTRLADVPTSKPEAIVKGAFVATRRERDPSISRFTGEFGGYFAPGVDSAIIAVTAGDRDDCHKIVLSWSPGKSILANGTVPCFHADPHLGDLPAGKSAAARGIMLFTDRPLPQAVAQVRAMLEGGGRQPVRLPQD